MAKKKRDVPQINATSTADIAFMLLILTISGVRHWDLIMNLLPVPV